MLFRKIFPPLPPSQPSRPSSQNQIHLHNSFIAIFAQSGRTNLITMVEIENEVRCLATSFVTSSDNCCYRP
jgi:hypothetical protein